MKKLLLSTLFLAIGTILFAQSPNALSYQAVIRNTSNQLVANQSVGVQISILETSASGSAVYVETHTAMTNANGLLSIEVGNGAVVSGDFSAIDWGADLHFIKSETDPAGGTNYTIVGTSQLLSVPYALHASTANNVVNDAVNDADADPTNEIELPNGGTNGQVLQTDGAGNYTWVNQTVDTDTDTDTQLDEAAVDAFVANNGYLTTEVDGSVTNEIELPVGGSNGQVLQTDGSGNYTWVNQTVDTDTDTQLDETAVDAFVANNGYLTSEVDGSVTNEIELPVGGSNGQVLQTDGSGNYTWVNQTVDTDTDTQLDEAAVDAFVANNGYLTTEVDGSVTNELELPSQTGHAGKVLTTDGSAVSWTTPSTGSGTITIPTHHLSYAHQVTGEYIYLNGAGGGNTNDILNRRSYTIAPFDGELKTVYMSTSAVTGNNTTVALRKNFTTTDVSTSTVNMTATRTIYKFDFTGATFSAGDALHMFITPGQTITSDDLVITAIWEYTP